MARLLIVVLVLVSFSARVVAAEPPKSEIKTKEGKNKDEPQRNDKDPLAQFSDEDLVKIDFCFNKFVEAIGAKDAKVVAAFLSEMPKNLQKLDLKKPADQAAFLKEFAAFDKAELLSAQRMAGGIGQVTYTDSNGQEKTQRMQNVGGRWKLAM